LSGIVAQEVRVVKRDLDRKSRQSIFKRRKATPDDPDCDYKNSRRQPNPKEFALKNFETAMAEKRPEANWGYANRSPGKKIAVSIKGREEGDSQTAVRHGV
jgi:hypothetical protein